MSILLTYFARFGYEGASIKLEQSKEEQLKRFRFLNQDRVFGDSD